MKKMKSQIKKISAVVIALAILTTSAPLAWAFSTIYYQGVAWTKSWNPAESSLIPKAAFDTVSDVVYNKVYASSDLVKLETSYTKEYDGLPLTVTVDFSSFQKNAASGTGYIYYKGAGATVYPETLTPPTETGTYSVTACWIENVTARRDYTNNPVNYGAVRVWLRTAVLEIKLSENKPAAGLNNFSKSRTYPSGLFSDVPANEWYADSVKQAYEFNIVNGVSETAYDPTGNITVAGAITIAARLHSIYYTGNADKADNFSKGGAWYKTYFDYAAANGIAGTSLEPDTNAARGLFAVILESAFPNEALKAINEIPNGKIPDIPSDAWYNAAVYRLYRAGIVSGNDEYGTFTPDSPIQRSAVASIVLGMVDASHRRSFKLQDKPAPTPPPKNYVKSYDNKAVKINAYLEKSYPGATYMSLYANVANLCDKDIVAMQVAYEEGVYPNYERVALKYDTSIINIKRDEEKKVDLRWGNGVLKGSFMRTGTIKPVYIRFADGTIWTEKPVNQYNAQAVYVYGYVKENSIGTPELKLSVKNLSNKVISSIEFSCNFVDSFGDIVSTASRQTTYTGVIQNAKYPPIGAVNTSSVPALFEEVGNYSFNLVLWNLAYDVTNIKITRIRFGDGSIWNA